MSDSSTDNNNTKEPQNNVAALFGGDSDAGTIPVHRSTMKAEPVIYAGAFLDTATQGELVAMMQEDFKAHGFREHRVKIMRGKLHGEYVVIFDQDYQSHHESLLCTLL